MLDSEDMFISDQQLFADIATGNERSFAQLFYRYHTRVYRLAYNVLEVQQLAQEVVQEVFLKLWLTRETLGVVEHPHKYIFRMARNRALDQLDRLVVEDRYQDHWAHQAREQAPTAEELFLQKESMDTLRQAMELLPAQQRLVFQLSKLEGCSRHEIADRLQISPHTVKNHLAAAIKTVQQYLRDHDKIVAFIIFFNFWNKH